MTSSKVYFDGQQNIENILKFQSIKPVRINVLTKWTQTSTIIKKSPTACTKKVGKVFEDTTETIGLNRSMGDQLLQLLGNKAAAAADDDDDDN